MDTHKSALQQALDEYSHLDLTRDIVAEGSYQIGGGGFSDVFRSKMRPGWRARTDPHLKRLLDETHSFVASPQSDPDCVMIAVKRLRFWSDRDLIVEKAIAKELKIWTRLSHSNVLPILGYVHDWTGTIYPSFISPWMKNGTLRNYMKRSNIDTYAMAEGIISGLEYLHSQNVVHADLKCDNVLLSATLQPLLADFGLSRQIIASVSTSTTTSGGTLRWKAPELIGEGEGKANEQSDVWAFGMTLFELLTKDVPYSGMNDGQVLRSLFNSTLPAPPDDLNKRSWQDQRLWTLCKDCWIIDSSMRPTAIEVKTRVNHMMLLESITQFTQLHDIYPHLNLTHIVERSYFPLSGYIPSSYFNSPAYRDHRRYIYSRFTRDVFNLVPKRTSKVRIRLVNPCPLWFSEIRRKPSVIAKEMATLVDLSHPNVLPFLGYDSTSNERLLFVFPEADETLGDYMKRKEVNILPMAEGIASGLSYLHSEDVVCSCLRSFNVKLSPTLRPLIEVSELWLSQPDSCIPQEKYQWMYEIHCRWMAMEIFDDRHIRITSKETDVWAFGMTILELFTKHFPYGLNTSDDVVIENLKHHRLPPPPEYIAKCSKAKQKLWTLVQACWNFEPSERPTAQHLYERIQELIRVETSSYQVFRVNGSLTHIPRADFPQAV